MLKNSAIMLLCSRTTSLCSLYTVIMLHVQGHYAQLRSPLTLSHDPPMTMWPNTFLPDWNPLNWWEGIKWSHKLFYYSIVLFISFCTCSISTLPSQICSHSLLIAKTQLKHESYNINTRGDTNNTLLLLQLSTRLLL